MLKNIYFCLLLITCPLLLCAKHNVDSLKNAAKANNQDSNRVKALNELSQLELRKTEYDSAKKYAEQVLAIIKTAKPLKVFTIEKANALGNLGVIYEELGKYSDALQNCLDALKIFEDLDDRKSQAAVQNTISNVYWGEQNYTEALKNADSALAIRQTLFTESKKNGDTTKAGELLKQISNSYSNIGGIFDETGKYDSALQYQLKSLAIKQQLHDTAGIATSYNNLGNVYEHLKNYPEALRNYTACLEMGIKLNEKEIITISHLNIGIDEIKIHKTDDAEKHFMEALQLASKMGSKFYIDGSYQGLTQVDSVKGDFKAAFINYKLFIAYRDSLNNEANTKKTVQAQMNYEFDKKQAAQQAEQAQKDAVTEATKKKQQVIILLVSLGLLLVIIFSVMLFSRFKVTQKQKQIIEKQKLEVEHQKAIVDEKNKDITDSIHYASRIQHALLTSTDFISKRLKEYFILFKPRDIVSGDFYWANEVETNEGRRFLICAGDCTGHGVPGAFMSLLNISLLNEVNLEKKINEPAKILDTVREHIIKALNPEGDDKGSKDGMDCALCSFSFTNYMLDFACANNPLWLIRNNECMEFNADKMPVGIQNEKNIPFTLKSVSLQKGDMIYIFTDGYADQFGGPKGKKFKYKQLQEKLLAISNQPMDKQKQELERAFDDWKGNLEQVDDVLIIGIRI